jgi:hypothetical protein
MNKKIFVPLLSLFSLSLIGCGSMESSTTEISKEEPIYQGMSVNRIYSGEKSSSSAKYAKDISDLVNPANVVDSTIRYYVNPGEVFRLHISLSNPSKYEIQSITMNGKKYASYMFADRSDLENVYLEISAPECSGYQVYTLEGMKYISSTTIKDISVGENNSLSVGVKYSNSPSAEISNTQVTATSYRSDVYVSDINHLVKDDTLYFYVTDGEKVIQQKELHNGNNSISLNNLSCSNSYQVGVSGQVDLADGRGVHHEWLATEAFVTDDIYDFNDVNSDEDSVSFSIEKNYDLTSQVNHIDLLYKGECRFLPER